VSEYRGAVAAIVGATAVGKTDLSLDVAEALGAEIVSLDSMQIYKGMDIGTAKPSTAMRERVSHHLIDVFPPSHELSVADFQVLARQAIDEIAERGRLPLLVGGSGLYFRAVVDDLRFPPRDPALRQRLEGEADRFGAKAMHDRLRDLDPEAAARIEPQNARRTVRALEVIELTGRPFSDTAAWDGYESRYALVVAGLRRERDDLRSRIEERALHMLRHGLIDEVDALGEGAFGSTARQALGYRQILEREPYEDEALLAERISKATGRFARRQESWFKGDPRIRWFEAGDPDVLEKVLSYMRLGVGDSARG
jgi:tRNA dimethylallyltransferase